MRVVLYAEGSLETGLPVGRTAAPGTELTDVELGPAHLLIKRCLRDVGGTSSPIAFEAPLRIAGRVARGSDLLVGRSLRRLLTWPARALAPDLAVVLVDGDGDTSRLATLTSAIEGLSASIVVGVCVHEFESWLAADLTAVRTVSGRDVDELAEPQNIQPGAAKHWLRSLRTETEESAFRRAIAEQCDLDRLRRQRSFDMFAKDLARHAR
jgi:hypothetical protein